MDELLKEYADYFAPEKVPNAMVKLIGFDENHTEWFCEGFELGCSGYVDEVGLKTYSDNPEFLKCLYEFAQADSTGSTYAIWRQAGELDEAPIIAFGSEGGVQVVAQNLIDLFRILTLDAEPMIDWTRSSTTKRKVGIR